MGRRNDSFTREGAEALAHTIREYWGAQGHAVVVTVECFAHPTEARRLYQVRSNLVNGLPRVEPEAGDEPSPDGSQYRPVPSRRECMTCGQTFDSEGAHNRQCDACRRDGAVAVHCVAEPSGE